MLSAVLAIVLWHHAVFCNSTPFCG